MITLKQLNENHEKINLYFNDMKTYSLKEVAKMHNVSEELLKEITNIELIKKYYECVKLRIEHNLTVDEVKKQMLCAVTSKEVVNYLLTNDEKEDVIKEDEEDLEINDNIKDNINNFNWRQNQIKAIEETVKQNFCSGIHSQIMGSGKTFIILNLIYRHHSCSCENKMYIILCDRQEVLQKSILDVKKYNDLKRWNIIDMDKFEIIDCINYKPKKIDIPKTLDKPIILVINNALFRERNYKDLDNKLCEFIILDECHCISANKIYDVLRYLKYEKKISVIGFSATPLRDRSEVKLIDIFSNTFDKGCKSKKLNIISNYNLIDAIHDEIILPFKYHYVEITNTHRDEIDTNNKDVTKKILNDIIPTLPYKKIIVWCRTISLMKQWYDFFVTTFKNFDVFMTSSKDSLYNENNNCDLDKFFEAKNRSILVAVNRCREGSDIDFLDCGVYLDAVKKRSILVSLQTSGRIIRPDKEKRKTHGVIVDMFIMDKDKTVEMMTVSKVMDYYSRILNLTNEKFINENGDFNEYYEKMRELEKHTEINKDKKEITIKLDNSSKHDISIKLELTTTEIDWSGIKNSVSKQIDEKFGIDKNEKFKIIIKKLKDSGEFNIYSNFWEVYKEIYEKYNLPKNLYDEYKDIFDNKSWYEILEINTNRWCKNINEINVILRKMTDKYITKDLYKKIRRKNKKLPKYPKEFFKGTGFSTIEKEFNKKMDY